jgi:hypothetical protein
VINCIQRGKGGFLTAGRTTPFVEVLLGRSHRLRALQGSEKRRHGLQLVFPASLWWTSDAKTVECSAGRFCCRWNASRCTSPAFTSRNLLYFCPTDNSFVCNCQHYIWLSHRLYMWFFNFRGRLTVKNLGAQIKWDVLTWPAIESSVEWSGKIKMCVHGCVWISCVYQVMQVFQV